MMSERIIIAYAYAIIAIGLLVAMATAIAGIAHVQF